MVLASVILFKSSYNTELSNDEIENKARDFGMHYSSECKVLFGEDEKND